MGFAAEARHVPQVSAARPKRQQYAASRVRRRHRVAGLAARARQPGARRRAHRPPPRSSLSEGRCRDGLRSTYACEWTGSPSWAWRIFRPTIPTRISAKEAQPERRGALAERDDAGDRHAERADVAGRGRRPSCLLACRRHASQPVRQDGEPALWSKRRTTQPKCSATSTCWS